MFIRYTNKVGNESVIWTTAEPLRAAVALRYVADAHDGETLFCLRGRDLLLLPTISYYMNLVEGVQESTGEIKGPVLEHVQEDYTAALAWQTAHPEQMKYPDRPAKTA